MLFERFAVFETRESAGSGDEGASGTTEVSATLPAD